MEKELFLAEKQKLSELAVDALKHQEMPELRRTSLQDLISLLNEYTYENRLLKKGLLTRIIIDSLEVDPIISEQFIKFDQRIR